MKKIKKHEFIIKLIKEMILINIHNILFGPYKKSCTFQFIKNEYFFCKD